MRHLDAGARVIKLKTGLSGLVLGLIILFQGQGLLVGGTPRFQSPSHVMELEGADRVCAADFNGDGHNDLAVTGSFGAAILLNNGSGGFSAQTNLPFGALIAIAAGDFNEDGLCDLATMETNGTVSICLNRNGSFEKLFSGISGNNQLLVADFDQDGHLDLVTNGNVHRGDGLGYFPRAGYFWSWAVSTAIADFNGDGNLDVVQSGSSGLFALWMSFGDGTGNFNFSNPLFPPTEGTWANTYSVAAADFNKDGSNDITWLGDDGRLHVALNDGMGQFSASNGGWSNRPPHSVNIADFNADGHPDIHCGGRMLVGRGDGRFDLSTIGYSFLYENWYDATHSHRWVVADLNGDNLPDIVTTRAVENQVTVLFNRTINAEAGNRPEFSEPISYELGTDYWIVSHADYNADGKMDLSAAGSGDPKVLLHDGSGGFTTHLNPGLYWLTSALVKDFNNDTKPDLLIPDQWGSELYFGDGNGTFQISTSALPDMYSSALLSEDFNKDGKVDVLDGGRMFFGNGNGTFQPYVEVIPDSAPNVGSPGTELEFAL